MRDSDEWYVRNIWKKRQCSIFVKIEGKLTAEYVDTFCQIDYGFKTNSSIESVARTFFK